MYQFRLDERHVHRSPFHSLRFQLAAILISSAYLPFIPLGLANGIETLRAPSTYNTLILCVAASVLTLFILRQVAGYYGLVISRWILPVFSTLFAASVSPLLFLRLPYSTYLIVASFVCSLGAFYVMAFLMARGRRAVCFIVPKGRATQIELHHTFDAVVLQRPILPKERNAVLVADLHASLGEEWERLLTEAALRGHPIYHFTHLREALTGKVEFDHLSENSFGTLLPTLAYNKIKRSIDFLAALASLPVLLPVLLVIALAIKLDSPGPALFRQRRMGHRGRIFSIIKFRTMEVIENGEDEGASVTLDGDTRITRLGRLLRRTRLDELPQVYNILRGEMSWIGPRPEAVSLSSQYANNIPYYRYRHLVRPGITGWAQVHQGHVTTVEDVRDKLCYDFYYVKNISFWIDVVIALRTFRVILTGFGAR